jgi:hypothetical protein
MSRATGEVYKAGHIIGYWLYDGTVDSAARPEIVSSVDEVWGQLYEMYKQQAFQPWPRCAHDASTHVDVLLYSDYGGGFHWPGKICEACRLITSGWAPSDDTKDYQITKDGRP